MPICPSCYDEYDEGTTVCATCGVPLVADDAPLPPRVDRLLGTFHPILAERIEGLLLRRGIAHTAVPLDDRVEVVVDRDFRDDLRAELAVNWVALVNGLDLEDRAAVVAAGGEHPGWFDAPIGAWIDREGRLQVDAGPDEEALADAGRLWGPTLLVIGVVVGLFGWYGQDSAFLLLVGIVTAVIGLLLPR
jgi:hypothetical protein